MTTVEETKEWTEEEEELLRTTFNLLDVNQDGFVDFAELQVGLGRDIRKSVIVRAIESADKNDDNKLDFEEFKVLMKSREIDLEVEEEIAAAGSEQLTEAAAEQREAMLLQKLGKGIVSQDTRRSSLFGHLAAADESGQDLAQGLKDLDEELMKIPEKQKKQFLEAKEKCPQLFGDKFKIMFLRSEQYDAKRAATKIATHWEERVSLFGDEKAFLPLTLSGALKDDIDVIESGIFNVVPKKDDHGQSLFFGNLSLDQNGKFDSLSKARALWYFWHAMLEDEDAQLNGIVLMIATFSKLSDFDPRFMKSMANAGRYCLPMRMACVHICYVPSFIAFMARLINPFIGEMKHRRRLHRGTAEEVLASLEGYGLPAGCVPVELGGSCELDNESWLKARREAGL